MIYLEWITSEATLWLLQIRVTMQYLEGILKGATVQQ